MANAADLDGDGAVDFVCAGVVQHGVHVGGLPRPASGVSSALFGPLPSVRNIADLDGDGDPDLVTGLLDGNGDLQRTVLYRNHGAAHYGFVGDATTSGQPLERIHLPWQNLGIDFDGDGDMVSRLLPPYADSQVHLNDGAGVLAPGLRSSEYIQGVVDFDGDGVLDLVTRGNTLSVVAVARGTGQPAAPFQPAVVIASGLPHVPDHVAVRDMDGDGLVEIVCSSWSWVRIYQNTSTPGAVSAHEVRLGDVGSIHGHLWVEDVDADGRLDLVEAGAALSHFWRAARPLSRPAVAADFEPAVVFASGPCRLVDVDSDGDPDLLGRTVGANRTFHGPAAGGKAQYGRGTAGEAGVVPLLGATGDLRAGGTHVMTLTGITGPTIGAVFLGFAAAEIPDYFVPGLRVLVDRAGQLPVLVTATSSGAADASATVPLPLPPWSGGIALFEQALLLDPAASQGFSSSNGLRLDIGF